MRSGNTVFVQIEANILPRNIASSLASQIVLFVPSVQPNPASKITIWVKDFSIFVALEHSSSIPSYIATFILNTDLFGDTFASMGYTIADSFLQVSINSNLPESPSKISIPDTAFNSRD